MRNRFTWQEVVDIRRAARLGFSTGELAECFGVTGKCIREVVAGRSYQRVG